MPQNEKPRCEDIGFFHAWEHPELSFVNGYGVKQRSDRERYCQNCGKRQALMHVGVVKGAPGTPPAVLYEWKDAV